METMEPDVIIDEANDELDRLADDGCPHHGDDPDEPRAEGRGRCRREG